MKKYKVTATVQLTCSRVLEADSAEDAWEQSEHIGANEWVEGFTVESEDVELEDVTES